jgi:hypothetical protein
MASGQAGVLQRRYRRPLWSSSCITTDNLVIGEVVPVAAAVSDAPPTGYARP